MPAELTTPDPALEHLREYLGILVRMQLKPALHGQLDPSGIVQQTLLEVHEKRAQWQQLGEAQRVAWLKTTLAHNLADEVRKHTRRKRGAGRVLSLESLEGQSSGSGFEPAAEQSTPSQRAARNEQSQRLAQALAKLPEAQREAVVLHHLERWSLLEIASHLRRSKLAVVGLLHRGLVKLRKLLPEEGGDFPGAP
jgi:RNA polymerase sigma-70 factor (ECF subfamily)